MASRRIHEGGALAVNACDGSLWSVLEDFLMGCEVDGYIEIDWHAGMDLKKLKTSHGTRTVPPYQEGEASTMSNGPKAPPQMMGVVLVAVTPPADGQQPGLPGFT